MKTTLLSGALLFFYAGLLSAQSQQKKATVHIKKVEKVNGVEKITDTTYTTYNPSEIKLDGGNATVREWTGADGKKQKVMIIENNQEAPEMHIDEKGNITVHSTTDTKGNAVEKQISISMPQGSGGDMIINMGAPMSPEEEKAWNEKMAGSDVMIDSLMGKTLIIKKGARCNTSPDELKNAEEIRVTIVRKINISDASADDMRLLGKPGATTDGKLSVEKMEFYPNPNNGHFNLSFTLPDKGDTEVKILDIKGQLVFSEKLGNFSGSYSKEVDISKSPKGVYFIRVEQGPHALVKKVVVD